MWLLAEGSFECVSLRAIPEGRVIHPHVPLAIVQGPAAVCQLLETALLNHLNYPILVATKASRVRQAAGGRPVLEFGLRRGQGKGAIAGGRAALIGGADFTSNVGLSHAVGFPAKGTHGHSMVQLFMSLGMDELGAFRRYAEVYPDNCVLLVDTVDTLNSGMPNALTVFEELRASGFQPKGVRLDSGDLGYLATQAARMLDQAGFPDAWIVLSSDLDELVIWQIAEQIRGEEVPKVGLAAQSILDRLVYGVGTRLITSWGSPALSAAFKLVAVHRDGRWKPSIKLSDSPTKSPNPGHKNAWRIYDRRGLATADLARLGSGVKRLINPHVYHVSVSGDLWNLKQNMTRAAQSAGACRNGRSVPGGPS